MARRRGAEHHDDDDMGVDESSSLDAVMEYAASQHSSALLDVNSQSAVGDTVYLTVHMRVDYLPHMARFMYNRGKSVFIEYISRAGKMGWFLVVRRVAMDEPIHTQTALFVASTGVTKRGESVEVILPAVSTSINMTWTRDVSFCRLSMQSNTSLMCTVPARLLAQSNTAVSEPSRSFTPEPTEVAVRPSAFYRRATTCFKSGSVLAFVLGVCFFLYAMSQADA